MQIQVLVNVEVTQFDHWGDDLPCAAIDGLRFARIKEILKIDFDCKLQAGVSRLPSQLGEHIWVWVAPINHEVGFQLAGAESTPIADDIDAPRPQSRARTMNSTIRDRKDNDHTAQLNVYFENPEYKLGKNSYGQYEITTIWAVTHEAGLCQLREEGLLLAANGPNHALVIPWHQIRGVKLMGTADPAAVKAAQDAYDEECPRC